MTWHPKTFVADDDSSQSQGWTPKTFVPDDESPGILETIGNAIAPGFGTLSKTTAMNPDKIIPAAKDFVKAIPRATAETASGLANLIAPYSPQSDFLNAALPTVPNKNPDATSAVELASGFIPGGRAAESAPEISQLGSLGEGMLKTLKDKLGNAVEGKSNNFINNLLHGKNLSEVTEPVAQEIRDKYAGIQKGFGTEYDALKQNAASRGYSGVISKQYPGISVATDEKGIDAPNFKNDLSKLDLSKYSSNIKESLDKFNNNPSFSEAHDLQSLLGKEGSTLKTNKDGSLRNLGSQLLNTRKSLVNDIHSTFQENGDNDLSQLYKDIGQRYKNQSTPYVANSTLRNIVLKKGIQEINPTTIGNLLKKNDVATQLIRNDLSSQSKDLLLANEMKGAIKETPNPDGTLSRTVDPKTLIDLYSKGDNKGISYLRNPNYNQQVASLISDLKRQENISRIKSGLKSSLKWGVGLGTGAFGLNEVRKYI